MTQRSRWACTPCRKRKIKCDAAVPRCSQCLAKSLECDYAYTRQRAPTSRKSRHDLIRSLERVENKLESVLSVASLATTPSHRHTNSPSRVLWPCVTYGLETSCPDVLYQLVRRGTSVMMDQSESIIDFTYQGSCQIFSLLNTKCVDLILGDHSFSIASRESLKQVGEPCFTTSLSQTAVPRNLRQACLESLISESTSACGMFQTSELIAIFREYDHKRTSSSPKVCAAVNIVCAYAIQSNSIEGIDSSERCLLTALNMMPSLMLEQPDSVAIGALLLMALFLSSTSRLPTSAMVLGVAAQMMFLAGFHKLSTTLDETAIHNHRLLLHAYILDQNLSLWLGKPPLLSSNIVPVIPRQEPCDGYGTIYLQDGTSFNCLKEQLLLAKIQSKAYEKLRSPASSSISQELHAEVSHQLLEELILWRQNLPALIKPLLIPKDLDKKHVPWLSTIICTFHQVENSIRSSIFSHISFFDNVAFRNQAPFVVSSCASTTRELVAILNALNKGDLQRSYLLPLVAWNLDSLFLHVAYNRHTSAAQHDTRSIRAVMNSFEGSYSGYCHYKAFVTTKLLCDVASRASP